MNIYDLLFILVGFFLGIAFTLTVSGWLYTEQFEEEDQ
jgi:hypothetical protein